MKPYYERGNTMSEETMRWPMPKKLSITADDVLVPTAMETVTGRRVGKFYVDEGLLRKVGARALYAAVEDIGRRVAYEYGGEIERVVHSFVLDRTKYQLVDSPFIEPEAPPEEEGA